jgi:exosome complex component RRP4
MEHKIVIPGQLLSDDAGNSGSGTYVKEGKVYSLLYGIMNAKNKISVLPFSSKYVPSRKDFVVGTVINVTPSNWIFDIGSPYDGLLHVSEYPRRVDSDKMSGIMSFSDSALLRVKDVSSSMKVELTMRERGLRALKSGRIIEIAPAKVPRVIGHGGSMVSMLKKETNCEIFVGQNGRIWIEGKDNDMDRLGAAIEMIMQQSHASGLTDRVCQFLRNGLDIDSKEDDNTQEGEEADVAEDVEDECKVHEDTCRKVDALLDSENE